MKPLVLVCAVLAAGVLAFLFIPRLVGPKLLERGRQEAARYGVRFDLEEPHYRWTVLSGRVLRIAIVRRMFFARLELLDFAARASLSALARGILAGEFDAELLNGRIHAAASMQRERLALDLALDGAQLAAQPELQMAGVTSGSLSLSLRQGVFSPRGPEKGALDLNIAGFTRRRSMLFKSVEESLKLPEIIDASLRLSFMPEREGAWLASLKSKSNLLELETSGSVSVQRLELAGRVFFNPDGAALKALLLKAAHAESVNIPPQTPVIFTVSGTPSRPVLKVTGG